jgi:hypothetical protein
MDDPEPSSRATPSAPTGAAASRENNGKHLPRQAAGPACRCLIGCVMAAGSPAGGRGWQAWSYASCATS